MDSWSTTGLETNVVIARATWARGTTNFWCANTTVVLDVKMSNVCVRRFPGLEVLET